MRLNKTEDATPNAGKFMRDVLRGSSYTFTTAIADLIDNSIEAGASHIEVKVDLSDLRVFVLDDGSGMDDQTHMESMKIAAETRKYSDSDLGKYGTGMKAASLSQAARVTVATRKSLKDQITVRCLDMDHILEVNDWSRTTLVLDSGSLPDLAKKHFENGVGTVVIWEKLDKVLSNSAKGNDAAAREELLNQLSLLEQHLAMVFHRFLDGSIPGREAMEIVVNGQNVRPWDPFARAESTIVAVDKTLKINGFEVGFTGYVLPGEKEMSKKAFSDAAGPKRWLEGQGFYVYRNFRLIRWGGWLRQRGVDEHLKLARIALDIPSSLDQIFTVNVAKSSISIPETISKTLTPLVKEVTAKADQRYRSQSRLSGLGPGLLPGRERMGGGNVQRRMSAQTFASLLSRIASAENLDAELDLLKKAIRENSPTTAKEIGW